MATVSIGAPSPSVSRIGHPRRPVFRYHHLTMHSPVPPRRAHHQLPGRRGAGAVAPRARPAARLSARGRHVAAAARRGATRVARGGAGPARVRGLVAGPAVGLRSRSTTTRATSSPCSTISSFTGSSSAATRWAATPRSPCCAWPPERVKGLVLADTKSGGGQRGGPRRPGGHAGGPGDRGGVAAVWERMQPGLLGRTTRASRPDVVERVRRLVLEQPAEGVRRAIERLRSRPDSTPLLCGDRLPDARDRRRRGPDRRRRRPRGSCTTRIPAAELAVIRRRGAPVGLEQPQRVQRGPRDASSPRGSDAG